MSIRISHCDHDPANNLDPSDNAPPKAKIREAIKLAMSIISDPLRNSSPSEPKPVPPPPVARPAPVGGGRKPPPGFKLPGWIGKIDAALFPFELIPSSWYDGTLMRKVLEEEWRRKGLDKA